mmetsp:Transcript_1646/g.4711  ORF Transcript_1646/g.4711 Transcript_1646/m.4711 type:complete len:354 (+) Transcript_1646:610-1671(+)
MPPDRHRAFHQRPECDPTGHRRAGISGLRPQRRRSGRPASMPRVSQPRIGLPAHDHLATLDIEVHLGTHRQADLGAHMAKGQARQHRRLRAGPQRRDRVPDAIAAVQRRLVRAAEITEQHRRLGVDDARLLQLQQHALDPVGMLIDVFEEEDAALDLGPVRRAQQRAQHREVAAPEPAARLQAVETGRRVTRRLAEAHRLQRAAHRLDKAIARDLVDAAFGLAAAEVIAGQRARPHRQALAMGDQSVLQRGQVAVADPARAVFDAVPDAAPVDLVEQPGQAIAAARRQSHRRCRVRDAMQGGEPGRVVAAKALMLGQRVRVDRDVKAELAQPLGGALEFVGRGQHAGGREQGQ